MVIRLLVLAVFSILFGFDSARAIEISPVWLVKQGLNQSHAVAIERNRMADIAAAELSFRQRYSLNTKTEIFGYANRLKSINAFAGERSDRLQLNSEVSQFFSTGTQLFFQAHSQGNKNQQVAFSKTGALALSDRSYNEFLLSLSLKQSLWKNAFGRDDQALLQSIRLKSESVPFEILKNLEDYSLYLIGLYYQTWVVFHSKDIVSKRLARERRRISIYQRQYENGFVESVDILQMKSSLIAVENQLQNIKHQIEKKLIVVGNEIHRDLLGPYTSGAVAVNFRDEELNDIELHCKATDQLHSYTMLANDRKLKSVEQKLRALVPDKPDIYVEAKVAANGIEDEEAKSAESALSFKTPQYYLGVGLTYSFGSGAEKAQYLKDKRKLHDLELKSLRDQSNLKTEMISDCLVFKNAERIRKSLGKKEKLEKQLVAELDKKYSLGKVSLDTLAQAERTLSGTQNELISVGAELNQTAWRIRRFKGRLGPFVELALKGKKIE